MFMTKPLWLVKLLNIQAPSANSTMGRRFMERAIADAQGKSKRFNVQSCTSDAMNLNQDPMNLTVGMEQDGVGTLTTPSQHVKDMRLLDTV